MSYIALSDNDKREMLARVGVTSPADLFHCIPEGVRLKKLLDLPPAMSEPELDRHMTGIAAKNAYGGYLSFLGAGVYDHFIPSIVDSLSSRTEFVTPYTPYQPEVSQGSLQSLFEYQSLICQLTGMDVSNASLYDGAMAAAEAVLMINRLTGRKRVLLAAGLHPQYLETIRTYTHATDLVLEEVGCGTCGGLKSAELAAKMGHDVAGLLVQSPNFFGIVEDLKGCAEAVHGHKGLLVALTAEALSLGLLEAPAKLGADIACGEAQSFGLPPSFGGPYLGFMACAKAHMRQMPGRIAGQTKDVDGKRGFVLTLSTREQHIRREKATSNICSNEAWCALRATMYLETLGKEGLREAALQNVHKAHYAAAVLTKIRGVKLRFSGAFFNEFVLDLPKPADAVAASLKAKGILGGLPLGAFVPGADNALLIAVTEVQTKATIDRLAAALEEVLR